MSVERIVTADKIVTVTTDVESREISYDDIHAAVKIELDDFCGEAPWEEYDGWEHTARPLSWLDHDDITESRGYARTGRNDPNVLIEIDDDDIVNRWGCDGYPGASKQVRKELIAQTKRDALDQLVKWYQEGWEYWYVGGEFKGYTAGVGHVDDYEYAETVRHEIADEIVAQLEDDGYIVVGRPVQVKRSNAQIRHDNRKRIKESYVIR
jgi:hypothetical protein